MIGQQGSLGVSPAELLAAKNMASGKSDMNKEISLGGDLTRLMLAAMQLKKSQAELEKLKLTQGANPQTTVAQDVQQGIAQLQGQPEEQPEGQPQGQPQGQTQGQPQQMAQMDSGIGGLPAGAMDNEDAFAGGGIVAFAAGDPVKANTNDFEADLKSEGVLGTPLEPFVRSIYAQESSSGKNTKTSNAGAVGGMQIIPLTFKGVADKDWDINNPSHSRRAGIRYAREMFDAAGGDPALAGAGYYGGPSGLKRAKEGTAIRDLKNPNAPDTLQYGRQIAERMLANATGSGNANAAEVPKAAPPPTGIKATLTPSERQAKIDNDALKAAGSEIKGFADSGVAALKDWATLIPRAASRAYGAVTGNKPPMTTNSWTPYSDANSAENTNPDVTNFADLSKKPPVNPAASSAQRNNYEATQDQNDLDASQQITELGKQVDPAVSTTPARKSLKDIADDTLYKGLTTEPLSRDAYDKQVNAIAKKEGTDPASMKEFFDKQSTSFTNQAVEAKKNRDVDLWMSAAQGFFAMGAGTSPRALQNFAMGAGIGVKQAHSALNEYGKAQREINAAQRDIAKFEMSHRETRTAQQIASYDKALTRADLFEAKKLGIAEKVWERIIRQDEHKLQKGQLRESQIQRLELERGKLLETAERNWLAHQEKNALDVMRAKDMTKPKDAAAAQARLDKDYKRIFSHVPPSVAGADRQAITRSAEDQALLAKYGG